MYVCIYVCICVCVCTLKYTHTHIHTHTHTPTALFHQAFKHGAENFDHLVVRFAPGLAAFEIENVELLEQVHQPRYLH
jgi:hypothetical protein